MAEKITKREMFGRIFAVIADSDATDKVEMADFIAKQIAMLDKRASAAKVMTKAQIANEGIKADIFTMLDGADGAQDNAMKATDIANALGLSVQKVSALLRQMVKDGLVIRTETKTGVLFEAA